MANAVSTAGMKLKYCVETAAGTRPTINYTEIPGIKVLPGLGDSPNMLDSTSLNATKNKTYIRGLDDTGGAYAITINDYKAFRTAWETCVSAYATAQSSNKGMWFEICEPAGSELDSFYFPGEPLALGFGGADVDSVLENTLNIAPQGDYLWAAASTTSA